jgi:DNA-binding SARP family transcriptional activator
VTRAATTRLVLLDGLSLYQQDDHGRDLPIPELPHGVQRLVAHLALAGRPGRSAIAGTLWPDASELHAGRNLRTALWRVQKLVPGLVEVTGGAVALDAGVRVDVRELTDWGRRVLVPGAPIEDCFAARPALHGELLPGWYDDWVLLERERLRQLRMHAWEALSEKLVQAGRYGEAVEAALEAIRAEPLRESAHVALIRAHAAEDNVVEALLAYQRFERRIGDELGLAPSSHLTALVRGLGRAPAPWGGRAVGLQLRPQHGRRLGE